MALNAGPLLVLKISSYSQPDIHVQPNFSNSRIQRELKCLCQRAVAPVDDEIPSPRDVAQRPALIVHKNLSSLPSASRKLN